MISRHQCWGLTRLPGPGGAERAGERPGGGEIDSSQVAQMCLTLRVRPPLRSPTGRSAGSPPVRRQWKGGTMGWFCRRSTAPVVTMEVNGMALVEVRNVSKRFGPMLA